MNPLFATLERVPARGNATRRRRRQWTPLERALRQLGHSEFSPCSVDGYKNMVVQNRAAEARKLEALRLQHHRDVVRRDEYVTMLSTAAMIGLGLTLTVTVACTVFNWIGSFFWAFSLPTFWIAGITGAIMAALLAVTFINQALNWNVTINKWRSMIYLIPYLANLVQRRLDNRAAKLPYLKWAIVPMSEFDSRLIPTEIKALCRRISGISPQVRFRVHYTAIDRQQTSSEILAQQAWYDVDPFIEAYDGERHAFIAVFDESGFRTA